MKQLKTKFFLFTTLLMFASTLLAQISVSGTVVDQDGQPIPGVTILDDNDQTPSSHSF